MRKAKSTPQPEQTMQQTRVKDCESARGIYAQVERANAKRRFQMSQTRNQIEGGLPMDPQKLKENNEEWRTNYNSRDAETAYNRTYLPYWKMVHDVPNKIAPSVEAISSQNDVVAKAIAEAFDSFLDDWGTDYFFHFMLVAADYVKFGPAYAMWCDDDCPRFEHARTENVLLPDKALANIDKWNYVCIETTISIADLYKQIKDAKAEKQGAYVGWNPDAIKETIVWAQNSANGTGQKYDSWTDIQDKIVGNDLYASEMWGDVPIVKMWVKNLDSTIAYYVFTQHGEGTKEFLYKSDEEAKKLTNVIRGLFYDPGVGGAVHSIKGFGIKNYFFAKLQNQMKSRLADAGMFATSMNFQQQDDTPNETPPIQNFGAVNVFPRGITQLTAYPNIAAAQGVIDTLANNQAEANYIYRDASKQIADTSTARQATILANLAEEVGSATASIWLSQIGDIYAECVRRLLKKDSKDPDAKLFIKRLKEKGVTKEFLDGMQSTDDEKRIRVRIKTGANPGTAGAALRDAIMKELLGLRTLPGMNQNAIRDAYLSNKLGTQAIKQFTMPEGVDSMPAQRREAIFENMAFGQGQPLPVDPSDAHFEHSDEHLKPLEGVVANFQKTNQITQEQLIALQIALPHVSEHAGYLKQDQTTKAQFDQIWPRLSNIQSVAQGIMAKIEREKQSQANEMQQNGAVAPQTS